MKQKTFEELAKSRCMDRIAILTKRYCQIDLLFRSSKEKLCDIIGYNEKDARTNLKMHEYTRIILNCCYVFISDKDFLEVLDGCLNDKTIEFAVTRYVYLDKALENNERTRELCNGVYSILKKHKKPKEMFFVPLRNVLENIEEVNVTLLRNVSSAVGFITLNENGNLAGLDALSHIITEISEHDGSLNELVYNVYEICISHYIDFFNIDSLLDIFKSKKNVVIFNSIGIRLQEMKELEIQIDSIPIFEKKLKKILGDGMDEDGFKRLYEQSASMLKSLNDRWEVNSV